MKNHQRRPPEVELKLNVDVSWTIYTVGIGGVLRTHEGQVKLALHKSSLILLLSNMPKLLLSEKDCGKLKDLDIVVLS